MKKFLASLLAGVSVFVISSAAQAQQGGQQPQPQPTPTPTQANQGGASEGEIVVTARRRSETLQDVPQTVNVVTDQAILDYALMSFEDIATLVPGITLNNGGALQGFNQSFTIRGIGAAQTDQAANQAVAVYINDAPIDPFSPTFQSQYDVGQIEVLKGPQGTNRGISAPSGAFTITTRPADPAGGFSGYAQTTTDDHDTLGLQGALNIPIVEDLLALRLSYLNDTDDSNGVHSVTSSEEPKQETESERVSLTFTPSDVFRARIMWEAISTDTAAFGGREFGPGACAPPFDLVNPGAVICTPSNARPLQPPITMSQQGQDADNAGHYTEETEIGTVNLDYSIANNLISYIGSYSRRALDNYSDSDGNSLVAARLPARTVAADPSGFMVQTHEIRVASEEPVFHGVLDYTFGLFSYAQHGVSIQAPALTRYPGSFGPANLAPNGAIYHLEYARAFGSGAPGGYNYTERRDWEHSAYGELEFHATDDLDITFSGRQLESYLSSSVSQQQGGVVSVHSPSLLNIGIEAVCNGNSVSPVGLGAGETQFPVAGLSATQARSLFGLGSLATTVPNVTLQPSTIYPGTCDAVIPAGIALGPNSATQTFVPGGTVNPNGSPALGVPGALYSKTTRFIRPEVYNVSLSYDITDNMMVYATTGTAFRQGSVSVTQTPICFDMGYCNQFASTNPEFSTSYEVGFKGYLFDRRAYVEVSAYRQNFTDFIRRSGSGVPYLGVDPITGLPMFVASGTFTTNANAKTDGVDALVRFDITDDWNVGVGGSYNHGRTLNATAPCIDNDFDGIPNATDLTPGVAQVTAATWSAAGGPDGPAICSGLNIPTQTSPLWSANLRSEYTFATPYFPGTRSFIRFNYNYFPENEGTDTNIPRFIVDERHMVDLFAGIRAEDRSWELQAFVRNLLDQDTLLSRIGPPSWNAGSIANPLGGNYFTNPGGSQYQSYSRVAEREIGMTLRYSFGG